MFEQTVFPLLSHVFVQRQPQTPRYWLFSAMKNAISHHTSCSTFALSPSQPRRSSSPPTTSFPGSQNPWRHWPDPVREGCHPSANLNICTQKMLVAPNLSRCFAGCWRCVLISFYGTGRSADHRVTADWHDRQLSRPSAAPHS